MTRLGIVCGLVSEAAIVRRRHRTGTPLLRCDGPGPLRAARAARSLLADGADALLSFGVAGGLDPDVGPGTVVVAERVMGPDGSVLQCNAAWRDRVTGASLAGVETVRRPIASSDRPLRSVREKSALFQATGAAAVDMESFAVAAVARDLGVRFLALRAIADPASRAVPEAALRALGADGHIRPLAAFRALLACPGEIGSFVAVARDGRVAFTALRRVASLGPGFGLV